MSVFLKCFLPNFLTWGLSLNPKLTGLLASLGDPPPMPPQGLDYRHPPFYVGCVMGGGGGGGIQVLVLEE